MAESSLFRMCISRGLANEPVFICFRRQSAPWNEQVDQEVARAIDQYFKQEEQTQRMALLKAQIDDALETGNKEAFLELSDELNRLKQQ